MTTRQLRDIASYWGSSYTMAQSTSESVTIVSVSGEKTYYPESKWVPISGRVDGVLLDNLSGIGFCRDFKLRLRRLESLSDEEVFTLADIAIADGGQVDRLMCEIRRVNEPHYDPIIFGDYHLRSDGSSYHHDYWISTSGLFGSGDGDDGNEVSTYQEAAVFAYLQSIGVYIAGTIDEELVELMPYPPIPPEPHRIHNWGAWKQTTKGKIDQWGFYTGIQCHIRTCTVCKEEEWNYEPDFDRHVANGDRT